MRSQCDASGGVRHGCTALKFHNKNKSFDTNSVETENKDFDIRNKQEKICGKILFDNQTGKKPAKERVWKNEDRRNEQCQCTCHGSRTADGCSVAVASKAD